MSPGIAEEAGEPGGNGQDGKEESVSGRGSLWQGQTSLDVSSWSELLVLRESDIGGVVESEWVVRQGR